MGREVSPCAAAPGGFYYGKAFLSSTRCPKASQCPAVWGGIRGESYTRPAAAPSRSSGLEDSRWAFSRIIQYKLRQFFVLVSNTEVITLWTHFSSHVLLVYKMFLLCKSGAAWALLGFAGAVTSPKLCGLTCGRCPPGTSSGVSSSPMRGLAPAQVAPDQLAARCISASHWQMSAHAIPLILNDFGNRLWSFK